MVRNEEEFFSFVGNTFPEELKTTGTGRRACVFSACEIRFYLPWQKNCCEYLTVSEFA